MSQLTKSAVWQALQSHHKTMARIQMRDLFQQEPTRFSRFSLGLDDLLLDYSKNRIANRTIALLMDLANQADLEGWIARLFSGEHINNTEGRAAGHIALRNRSTQPLVIDGNDVMPAVNDALARVGAFVAAVRDGGWTGFAGDRITDVVSIGIGGSDLGPRMAAQALHSFAKDGPRLHFVANVDGTEISDALAELKPTTTLFIVMSKT
ncbi:MAG: glucose-6-phosphate isomerase, partial [Dongiaceae bacterium]